MKKEEFVEIGRGGKGRGTFWGEKEYIEAEDLERWNLEGTDSDGREIP